MQAPAEFFGSSVGDRDVRCSTEAIATPRTVKRAALSCIDGNSFSKHRRVIPPSLAELPLELTEHALHIFDKQYNYNDVTFNSEVRVRAVQDAGTHLGFSLTLGCYEQAANNFDDWLENQNGPSSERRIFKDKKDIRSIKIIAQAFDIILANEFGVKHKV